MHGASRRFSGPSSEQAVCGVITPGLVLIMSPVHSDQSIIDVRDVTGGGQGGSRRVQRGRRSGTCRRMTQHNNTADLNDASHTCIRRLRLTGSVSLIDGPGEVFCHFLILRQRLKISHRFFRATLCSCCMILGTSLPGLNKMCVCVFLLLLPWQT